MLRTENRQHGFTLLEVVMAISLMTAVLLILFLGLRLGMNAVRRGNERLEKMQQRFAGTDVLQAQIAAAVPTTLQRTEDGKSVKTICFRSSPQQARFLSRRSWAGDRSRGLWLAAYQIGDMPDGHEQLTISETAALDGEWILSALLQDSLVPTHTQSLGEPADHIEFSFWESSTSSVPGFWTTDWKAVGQELLPRALQIHWQRGDTVETATFVFPVVKETPR